jgi:hypothetical protein
MLAIFRRKCKPFAREVDTQLLPTIVTRWAFWHGSEGGGNGGRREEMARAAPRGRRAGKGGESYCARPNRRTAPPTEVLAQI